MSLWRLTPRLLRHCQKNSVALSSIDRSGNNGASSIETQSTTVTSAQPSRGVASYIVLLPEVPPDSPETNPVMRLDSLPAFSEITPVDCVNGVAKLSIEFETELSLHSERLTQMPNTFESVI